MGRFRVRVYGLMLRAHTLTVVRCAFKATRATTAYILRAAEKGIPRLAAVSRRTRERKGGCATAYEFTITAYSALHTQRKRNDASKLHAAFCIQLHSRGVHGGDAVAMRWRCYRLHGRENAMQYCRVIVKCAAYTQNTSKPVERPRMHVFRVHV